MESYSAQQLTLQDLKGVYLLCLLGRILVGKSTEYVIIRDNLRGIDPKEYYCDTTGLIPNKVKYFLILQNKDSIQIIRNLDSLEVLKKYPFVNFELLYDFKW